jgi:hypothetical protein
MQRTFVGVLLGFGFAGLAYALQVGDSEEEVLKEIGKPNVSRQTAKGAIWRFKDGTTVKFEGKVVSEIVEPATAVPGEPVRPVARPEVRQPPPATNRPAANKPGMNSSTPSTFATLPASPSASLSAMTSPDNMAKAASGGRDTLGFVVFFAGVIVLGVGKIMMLIVAFRSSIWWVLGCLFVPFVSLIFIISHWEDTKKILAWQFLVGMPLMVGGILMLPRDSLRPRGGSAAPASVHGQR